MKRAFVTMSALALAASTLTAITFTVSTVPAFGDHCDPAEQSQTQAQRQQNQDQQGQDQNQQNQQNQQGQDQNQDQQGQDQQGQDQQNQDPAAQDPAAQDLPPAGGAVNQASPADPAETPSPETPESPEATPTQASEDEPANESLSRRRPTQPSRTPTQAPPSATPTATPTPSATPGHDEGEEAECADLGPFAEDFVDIRQVQRNVQTVRTQRSGSSGTFTSRCGRNENRHNNPDNFIVAPGVSNGAHHLHDYVGNLSTDGFSTDQSLAAAGTTCAAGDRSTYFWPVLRDRTTDANVDDADGNVGTVLTPRQVSLQFRGNPVSKVTAMPRFIRIITGDAKAATNGGANGRAQWSCTGFTNRVTTKYTLCPRGSQLLRILEFPSCWDGQNTDSANHRTHVLFPDARGACPSGTKAIPQLQMTLTYATPRTASFAVDAFPEQLHNPVTDHGDFANVMSNQLMRTAVDCINRGRRC
ncbi:DUF1996 domain-containing protein [Streptosporangium sp. 'caverna']|uniref:DUF1996 domain-containing protein n=1 Tax=Streptosporangium sp. 'caverna' TaxID=2202249 RepID=UPI001EF7B82F|nr:DUF1996 domain-containing protein [Streptosporangium sp. 'caverna']